MGDSGPSRIPGSVQREKAQLGEKQNKEKEQRWYDPQDLSAFWVKCKTGADPGVGVEKAVKN